MNLTTTIMLIYLKFLSPPKKNASQYLSEPKPTERLSSINANLVLDLNNEELFNDSESTKSSVLVSDPLADNINDLTITNTNSTFLRNGCKKSEGTF